LETSTPVRTSQKTSTVVTTPGLTSAVKTTLSQTFCRNCPFLGSMSAEYISSVSSTGIVLEKSTLIMNISMKTTSVVSTPGLTSAVKSILAQTTTNSESFTLGSTSPDTTSLRTTSSETRPSVSSTGVVELLCSCITTAMKTIAVVNIPGSVVQLK